MKVLVVNDTQEKHPENLEKWVKSVSKELHRRKLLTAEQMQKELSLVFLEERDAKRLNWQYRSKDYATDVLSFETDDPAGFGELVLCPQVLKKQASDNKVTYEHEISYMVLHGVLHLLGFDYEKGPEDEKKMMGLQEEIFTLLQHSPKSKGAGKIAAAGGGKKAAVIGKTAPSAKKGLKLVAAPKASAKAAGKAKAKAPAAKKAVKAKKK